MNKRRYTPQEIEKLARSHVAYNWAASPGTHRNDIEWTEADTEIYMQAYREAARQTKNQKTTGKE